MVRINLLPPEIIEARNRRRRSLKIMSAVGVGILALGAVFAFLLVDSWGLKDELTDLEVERIALESEIREYEHYEEIQAEVDAKLEIANAAMGRMQYWPTVLTEIGTFIPQRVWLTDLALNYPHTNGEAEVGGSVLFRGLTYDHPQTAQWLKRLEGIEQLADARCRFSAETVHRDVQLVSFELNSKLHPGPEYDPMADRSDSR